MEDEQASLTLMQQAPHTPPRRKRTKSFGMKAIHRCSVFLIFVIGLYRVAQQTSWDAMPTDYSRLLATTLSVKARSPQPEQRSQFLPKLKEPTPPQWGLDRPDTFSVTGSRDVGAEDGGLVLILTDSRAGADALLSLVGNSCPDMPMAALIATEMPWLDAKTQQCTYAYWLKKLEEHRSSQYCDKEEDPRCSVIREIVGTTEDETLQKEQLLNRYVKAFVSDDTNLIPCVASCQKGTVKYLKIAVEWNMPIKVLPKGMSIRLTRRNYFERYMAFVMATKTDMWGIQSAEDKRKQVEAFKGFTLNLAEMLSFFDKFRREDETADKAIQNHLGSTLWIDQKDVRDNPGTVKQAIQNYVAGNGAQTNNPELSNDGDDWPRGKEFLNQLVNRKIVGEMLGTAGRADWIGAPTPKTIHLVLLDDQNQRPYDLPPGIEPTRVQSFGDMILQIQHLKADDWVVAANRHTTINPHIRSTAHWYDALSSFRAKLEQHHGKVVMASSSKETSVKASARYLKTRDMDYALAGPAEAVLRILNGREAGNFPDDGSMFGSGLRFEGVLEKIRCDEEKSETITSVADQQLFVSNTVDNCFKQPVKYPVWGDHNDAKIQTESILDHIDRLFLKDESLAYIDRHFGNEILYHVNSTGLFGSPVERDQYRVLPTEDLLVLAHKVLKEQQQSGRNQWPALQRSLRDDGFTYFGWYGDWKECNRNNAPGQQSVPVLTTCATVACNYSFPSPAYMTIVNAQPDMNHWLSVFDEFEEKYPWDKKIPKVFWRGGLTENDPNRVFESARWRLNKKIHEISDEDSKNLYDVGFTGFPSFLTAQIDIDEKLVGGFKPGLAAMNDFQQYKAILDMDGNSWSSRFSTMLCYNSLAIKVEPDYADHFFFDLIPWKHYVPIKSDLSDLIDNIKFVLDPANDGIVLNIIAAANQWCTQRLTKSALALDQLDIWNSYVERLDGPSTVPKGKIHFDQQMMSLPAQ